MKRFWLSLCLLLVTGAAHAQTQCTTLTQAQVLSSLSDTAPPGSITPQTLRNLACSSVPANSPVLTGPVTINGGLTVNGPVTLPNFGGILYATGLDTTGATSSDVALAAALATCSASGAHLYLPPGQIKITGVAGTIPWSNCLVEGAGVISGAYGSTPSLGTTILLTNTAITPFTVGSNWGVRGINFYWPNQTNGTTVYPALFTQGASTASAHWFADHINIVNAYDGFNMAVGAPGSGAWQISHSWIYAVHDAFQMNYIGDSVHFDDVQFTPGTWLAICNFSTACEAAIDAGSNYNTIFHLKSGAATNMVVSNAAVFDWRYGFKLDSGAVIGLSDITMTWDGVQTILDTTSGGSWSIQIPFRGQGDCGAPSYVTGLNKVGANAPCFNLGGNGGLYLDNFLSTGTQGSMVATAGANVTVVGGALGPVGLIKDGGDYYGVLVTGNPGGTTVNVQSTVITGNQTAHEHGIVTTTAASRAIIQNNEFAYLNDDVTIQSAPTTTITGNWAISTLGSSSLTITGSNGVAYNGNTWDKPPIASLSSCGTGPVSHGGFSGYFMTGSGTVNSCTITLPFVPLGAGGGACIFAANTGYTSWGNPGGTPPSWQVNFSASSPSSNVFYNCSGQQ